MIAGLLFCVVAPERKVSRASGLGWGPSRYLMR